MKRCHSRHAKAPILGAVIALLVILTAVFAYWPGIGPHEIASYWPTAISERLGWQISGPQALLTGTLDTRNGCLIATSVFGNKESYIVILPRGRYRQLPNGVIRIFGTNYRVGDRISLGGGGIRDVERFADLPSACVGLNLEGWQVISAKTPDFWPEWLSHNDALWCGAMKTLRGSTAPFSMELGAGRGLKNHSKI